MNQIVPIAANAEEAFAKMRHLLDGASKHTLTFLLVGRTGVGKSSTVNSLLGEPIAMVGEFDPTTTDVETYNAVVNGITFNVVDTPGLCDDIEEAGNDERYLAQINEKCPPLDSVWFVSRLDETRVTSDEKRAIKLLTTTFGAVFWDRAIIVFTHAASVTPDRFERVVIERSRLVRAEVARNSDAETAAAIPCVAVDNNSPTTPDGELWLGALFTAVLERIGENGTVPFLLAMAESIRPSKSKSGRHEQAQPRIELNEAQKETVRKTIDGSIIGGGALAGAAIGSLFGPAGAVIGGAVGAAIGIYAWLNR